MSQSHSYNRSPAPMLVGLLFLVGFAWTVISGSLQQWIAILPAMWMTLQLGKTVS